MVSIGRSSVDDSKTHQRVVARQAYSHRAQGHAMACPYGSAEALSS
jgi:hypothetical protein